MRELLLVLIGVYSSMALATGKLKVEQKFPAFNLQVLSMKGIDKKSRVNLEKLRGKIVIVDFWASWCEPCKKEMPALNRMYKKYKKNGLVIVGINVGDEIDSVKDFLKENPVNFTLAYDQGKIFTDKCQLSTMPSSFVLSRDGTIKFIHSGYREGDASSFDKEISSLL